MVSSGLWSWWTSAKQLSTFYQSYHAVIGGSCLPSCTYYPFAHMNWWKWHKGQSFGAHSLAFPMTLLWKQCALHHRRKGKEPCNLPLCCQLKCFWLPVTKSPTQTVLNNKRFIIPINKKSRGPSFHSLQSGSALPAASHPGATCPEAREEPSFLTNVKTFPRSHLAHTHMPMSYWPGSSYMLIPKPFLMNEMGLQWLG